MRAFKAVSISLVLVLAALNAHAKSSVTIRQKMTYSIKDQSEVSAAEVNKVIKQYNQKNKTKLALVPDAVDFTVGDNNYTKYSELSADIEAIGEDMGEYLDLDIVEPSTAGTCYIGNGALVADAIQALTDGPYSDQFTISYSQYKNNIYGEIWDEEAAAELKKFNAKSENVFFTFSISDGGEEQVVVNVAPCRP